MKLTTINAGYFQLDGGAMHGVVPKRMWQKANPAGEDNMCTWAMRCLLIEHGNYKILVDTGMGNKQDDKFFSYYNPTEPNALLTNLEAAGYKADDITDVFLTHLHFDHCGGALTRNVDEELVPTFPKAIYWSNHKHWLSAIQPNAREAASFLKENMLPLEERGLLRFVEAADGAEWLPDIRIRIVNGHTDSMMLPQIKYEGRTILFCADLVPSAAHVSLPWVMAYDMRPLDTLREKESILREAAANDWILFFEHDREIECCTLEETPKGVRMKQSGKLADFVGSVAG